MPKQTIPAGGFEASASGGLHASSKGETYPWTVQPRIRKYLASCGAGRWAPPVVYEDPHHYRVVWVAFNALTGEEIGAFLKWEDAALAIDCELACEALARDGGDA